MNIPDDDMRPAFNMVAEWARREALREALPAIPGEVEFRAYWVATGRPFREMEKAWADWQAGWSSAAIRKGDTNA